MVGVIIPPFQSSSDRGYKFLCSFQAIGLLRGQKKVLWIEGGVPPYDWSVTGTKFTLDSATTTLQFNFVTAADDAEVNIIETITIVDDEGTSVDCKVHLNDYDDYPCCFGISTPHLYDCCGDPDWHLTFASAETPLENKWRDIFYDGGCPPYEWEIIGDADEYLTLRWEYTNDPHNQVFIAEGAPITDPDFWDAVGVGDFCYTYCCLTEPDLEIDDANTDDTISAGGSADVEVDNGCPPFNWSVSGLGYSINPNGSSESRTAIVSCVTGTCGAQFGPVATVEVTDSCSTKVTHVIRNNAGSWGALGVSDCGCEVGLDPCGGCFSYSCFYPGVPVLCGDIPMGEEILGQNKWTWQHNCLCVAPSGLNRIVHFCKDGVNMDYSIWVAPSCPTPYSDQYFPSEYYCYEDDDRWYCLASYMIRYWWACW